VLICYGLTVLFGAIGLLVTWIGPDGVPVFRTRYAVPLYALVCLAAALGANLAGLTRPEEKRPADSAALSAQLAEKQADA
jgi:hypothetical protein